MAVDRPRAPVARPRIPSQRSLAWQDDAACRGLPVELFVGPDREPPGERRAREVRAVGVCAGCPVRQQCLEHALAVPEMFGVWGGATESERGRLRGDRGSAA